MALTTGSTISAAIFNEVMADRAIGAHLPKIVAWNHINKDSIDGAASLSKEYRKYSDLGPAVAATEGIDFATVTTAGYGTTVTMTPTEAAVARMDITTAALRRGVPGRSGAEVFDALRSGDYSSIVGIAQDYAERMGAMLLEKAESDTIALLDDLTAGAGTTNTDFSLADLLEAIFDLEAGEPAHENFELLLDQEQIRNLRAELLSTSGGLASALTGPADVNLVNFQADPARNGFKGSILGINAFQLSPSLRLAVGAEDVCGALICKGEGPPDGPMRGPINFLEGHPIEFLVDVDPSARTIELIGVWEYAVAVVDILQGVEIITDKP